MTVSLVEARTWIDWHQGFDPAMMECVRLDGAPVQIDKPDLQQEHAQQIELGILLSQLSRSVDVMGHLTCLSAAEVMTCSLPVFGMNLATYMLDVCP